MSNAPIWVIFQNSVTYCGFSIIHLVYNDNIGCNEVQSIATDLETTSDTATLTFTAPEDATFTCRLDGEARVECKYCNT